MSELLDSKGEPVTDLQFNLKKQSANHLADKKALHSGQGSTKPFKNMEDLESMASNIYAKAIDGIEEEYIKDKEAGLDINDYNSIMEFEVGYTPVGDTLLVKFIKEEQKMGSIILLDNKTNEKDKKAIVIAPGLYVTSLCKGDVIIMKASSHTNPFPPSYKRIIKGITFEEIPFEGVSGVFHDRDFIMQRIDKKEQK
jgi:hypothetical protein